MILSEEHLLLAGSLATLLLYGFGIASTYDAIMKARTPQGAIAWSLSLSTFPFLALPLYWIFGRTRFHGYIDALRTHDRATHELLRDVRARIPGSIVDDRELTPDQRTLARLAATPFSRRNQVNLFTTGQDTFTAIFAAIDSARDYVLLQSYIVRDDTLGRRLLSHIAAATSRGVRVYFLYDAIGCIRLRQAYLRDLRASGAYVASFRTTRGPRNRFQLNFRNHRKIVVTDGTTAFLGGYNVGDEYLGLSRRFGPWRDTHIELKGPAVLAVQLAFVSDWNWANGKPPEDLRWEALPAPERDEEVLVVPSGPADELETWKLLLLQGIRQADERFWLVSPYFVPDTDIVSALQLAALRGVDVRILLPEKADHLMVWLASFTYLPQMALPGIRFYRHHPGFLHQKVVLVDHELAIVGTANADHRSFRLNFEISLVGVTPSFLAKVEEMLLRDFENSRPCVPGDYTRRPLPFRFAAQLCRLMAPLL